MKSFFKIVFILVIAGILLLTISVAVLKIVFPKEKLKSIVVEKMSSIISRKVELTDVSIGLSGVKITDFKIHEKIPGQAPFIDIKELHVKLKLLPLLKKNFMLNSIEINEPKINIKCFQDMKFNFSDIIELNYNKLIGVFSAMLISSAKLKQAEINFLDESPNNLSMKLTNASLEISDLSITSPIKIKLETDFFKNKEGSVKTDINGKLKFKGKIDIIKRFIEIKSFFSEINGITSQGTGSIEKIDNKISLDIKLDLNDVNTENLLPVIEHYFKFPEKLAVKGTFDIDNEFKGTLNNLKVKSKLDYTNLAVEYKNIFNKNDMIPASLDMYFILENKKKIVFKSIESDIVGMKIKSEGSLSLYRKTPEIKFDIRVDNMALSMLSTVMPLIKPYQLQGDTEFNVYYINTPNNKKIEGAFFLKNTNFLFRGIKFSKLKTKIFFKENILDIDYIKGFINEEPFSFDFNIKNFKNPIGKAKASVSTLDMDKLLSKGGESKILKSEEKQIKPKKKWIVLPEPIKNASFKWDFKFKNIIIKNINYDIIMGTLSLKDGVAIVSPLEVRSCEGILKGKVTVTILRLDEIDYLADLYLEKLDIKKITKNIKTVKDKMQGNLSFGVKIRGRGKDMSTIYSRGNIKIVNGRFLQVPLFKTFAKSLRNSDFEKIKYKTISCSYVVKNGVLKTKDLMMQSDLMDVFAGGEIDIVHEAIDMLVKVTFPAGVIGGSLAELTKNKDGRSSVMLELQGTFDKPKYTYIISDDMINNGVKMFEEMFK